jgi:hypothetical protein
MTQELEVKTLKETIIRNQEQNDQEMTLVKKSNEDEKKILDD